MASPCGTIDQQQMNYSMLESHEAGVQLQRAPWMGT